MSDYIHKSTVMFITIVLSVIFLGIILVPFIGFAITMISCLSALVIIYIIFTQIEKRRQDQIVGEIFNEFLFWLIGYVVTLDGDEVTCDLAITKVTPISVKDLQTVNLIIPDTCYITKVDLFQKYTRYFQKDYIYIVTSKPFKECYPTDSSRLVTVAIKGYIFDQELGCCSVIREIGLDKDDVGIYLSVYNSYLRDNCIIKVNKDEKIEK